MQEDPTQYQFEKESGFLAEMESAKDDGDTLEAGVVGEIASQEIGGSDAGSFGSYDRIAFGGTPEPHRQNGVSKVSGDLQDDGDADVSAGTQIRLVLTDHQRNRQIDSTEWFDKKLLEDSDPAKQPTLKFDGVQNADWAKNGRVVVVQARNQRQSTTVSVANSNLNFPYIGAY